MKTIALMRPVYDNYTHLLAVAQRHAKICCEVINRNGGELSTGDELEIESAVYNALCEECAK